MLPLNIFPASQEILLGCSSLLSNLWVLPRPEWKIHLKQRLLEPVPKKRQKMEENCVTTSKQRECSEQCQQLQLLVVLLGLALSPRKKVELRPQIYRE